MAWCIIVEKGKSNDTDYIDDKRHITPFHTVISNMQTLFSSCITDPAKVTFTPTIQYLPFRLAGVVQCYIKSNPPLQYVTWTKDKRLLEPYQTKDIVIMNNGSLLFTRVNENHQGRYTCTPYNAQGTQGSSGAMEVLVRKPPVFTVEPEWLYQRKVGESIEMNCDAKEDTGTQRPTIQWLRRGKLKIYPKKTHFFC